MINMTKGVSPQTLDLSYIEFITIAPGDGDTETESDRERDRERENLTLGMESGKAKNAVDSSSGSSSRMSGPSSCDTSPLLQCTNLTGERVGLIVKLLFTFSSLQFDTTSIDHYIDFAVRKKWILRTESTAICLT
jgi:hypothetical protein